MNNVVPPENGVQELLNALGIRIGILLAGFVGGIISLQYLKNLSRPQTIVALFSSLGLAAYGTPVIVARFSMTTQAYQYGSAFILGLCALHIIPVLRATAPGVAKWIVTKFTGGIQPTQGDGGDK